LPAGAAATLVTIKVVCDQVLRPFAVGLFPHIAIRSAWSSVRASMVDIAAGDADRMLAAKSISVSLRARAAFCAESLRGFREHFTYFVRDVVGVIRLSDKDSAVR
jgi:hypothetical protein